MAARYQTPPSWGKKARFQKGTTKFDLVSPQDRRCIGCRMRQRCALLQIVRLRLVLSLIPSVTKLTIAVREGASVRLDFLVHITLQQNKNQTKIIEGWLGSERGSRSSQNEG